MPNSFNGFNVVSRKCQENRNTQSRVPILNINGITKRN